MTGTPPGTETDAATRVTLVERARAGDHDAFSRVVTPILDRLYGLAGLLLGDRGRAEDAVQEALLRAWRDLPRLRETDRFDAWLRRLVVNAAHDEGRRPRRRRGETDLATHQEPATSGDMGQLADRDELMHGFRQLSEEERTVVAMRYYLDLPSADAAASLGIGDVTYRSKLHRSLRKLQSVLEAGRRQARAAEGHGS